MTIRPTYASSIQEIQSRVDIVEVAEALGMAVVRRGSGQRVLCPFHADKTPSLTLYQSGHMGPHYHCFACGAHGDTFKLVEERRSCNFVEAVEWLASHLGIKRASRFPRLRVSQAPAALAVDWSYDRTLAVYRKRNGTAKVTKWLAKRGLPKSVATDAGLVLGSAGTLTGELRELFSENGPWRELQALFEQQRLIVPIRSVDPSESLFADIDVQFRDFFVDERVLFPIKDLSGNTIGIAGRLTRPAGASSTPKYLYSAGLAKSTTLYRGDVARRQIGNPLPVNRTESFIDVYICEGMMDALRLESLGKIAVALLGAQASEAQLDALIALAQIAPAETPLRLNIFLDRDAAGIKGAAKLALALAKRGIDSAYIWPATAYLEKLVIPADEQKDPDAILNHVNASTVGKVLEDWRHATGLAIIAEHLGATVDPDDVVDHGRWEAISLGRKYKAAISLARDSSARAFLLGHQYSEGSTPKWVTDTREFLDQRSDSSISAVREARQSIYIDDIRARFHNARTLARSGAARGEVPSDEAAWRRLDVGGTSFILGLQEQLASKTFFPMEPFDAVLVSRGFENDEHRLKAMPCPEDLVLQQYLMAEILTERFDATEETPFSDFIPAVRYYRDRGRTYTTAEDLSFTRQDEVLSFAYQIDMDVLEGRRTSTNQGMFRPFMQCWSEYIETLRRKAERFGEVHALRLDVRRYYDRLNRPTIRDRLVVPFRRAIEQLREQGNIDSFAPDFSAHRQNLADSLVDWFCDQSFDFAYYDPHTGETQRSAPGLGIPQGPVLSAWLATVALFPLDSAMRKEVKKIEDDEGTTDEHVAYARYVDDIFIIARSRNQLLRMRSLAEESARSLGLELVDKGGDIPPMASQDFRDWLSAGKAFVGSGPRPEVELMHLGDGETGSDTWQLNEVQRGSALELLSDQRLFTADSDLLADQLYTALQAADLRPSELPKLSRWIWYSIAQGPEEDRTAVWRTYWELWGALTQNAKWTLDPIKRPWEDPMFFALEGLEKVLLYSPPVSDEASDPLSGSHYRLLGLAKEARDLEFFQVGTLPESGAPPNVGRGAVALGRMFLSRAIVVTWIANHFAGHQEFSHSANPEVLLGSTMSTDLVASLSRAWITHSEIAGTHNFLRADLGDSRTHSAPLRKMFIWLHQAIALFGHKKQDGVDLLQPIFGSAIGWSAYHARLTGASFDSAAEDSGSRFCAVLSLLSPKQPNQVSESDEIHRMALSTLLAICPVTNLMHCLHLRGHLLDKVLGANPLPSLPGIDVSYLMLVKREKRPGAEPALDGLKEVFEIRATKDEVAIDSDLTLIRVRNGEILPVSLKWESVEVVAGSSVNMRALKGAWDAADEGVFAQPPKTIEVFEAQHLYWAADTFESLARINYEAVQRSNLTGEGVDMEYTPAWPFVVLSTAPENVGESARVVEGFSVSSLGYYLPQKTLGRFAYVRDGQGRLKSVEVPLSDAWVWRIGFALTDMLGLAFELDRFGRPSASSISKEGNAAGYIVREVLRRLRGEFASSSGPLPRHREHPHLPASTFRALELLRRFPKGASAEAELAFVLSVETESRAMEARLGKTWDFEVPGAATAFAELTASSAMLRISSKWASALPIGPAVKADALRRAVAAWLTFDARLGQLESNLTTQGQASYQGLSWDTLRQGVRLAVVVAWLRGLVFELITKGTKYRAGDIQIPDAWGLDSALLVVNEPSVDLGKYFQKAVSRQGSISSLRNVTPLGWLAILGGLLQIYKNDDSEIPYDFKTLNALAESLTKLKTVLAYIPESTNGPDWPLEWAEDSVGLLSDSEVFTECTGSLMAIDRLLELRVSVVRSEQWGVRARSDRFQDAEGRSWALSKTFIDLLSPDKHIESERNDTSFRYTWSETRTADANLIGISVLGSKFAEVVAIGAVEEDLMAPEHTSEANTGTVVLEHVEHTAGTFVTGNEASEPAKISLKGSAQSVPVASRGAGEKPLPTAPATRPPASPPVRPLDESSPFGKWNRDQRRVWTSFRHHKVECHIRVAVFQFRVDDSYRHPIAEVGFPEELKTYLKKYVPSALKPGKAKALDGSDGAESSGISEKDKLAGEALVQAMNIAGEKGREKDWTQTAMLPSWAEHRRRQLLEAALDSCDAFGVDVLVLPEYSVRPDTVAWLKEKLRQLPDSKLAVIAGTYRIHGNTTHPHFEGLHKEVLGAQQKNQIFSQNIDIELGAVLTLLQPYEKNGSRDVASLTRLKKYPSVALDEIFHPGDKKLTPLLMLPDLLSAMLTSTRFTQKPKTPADGLELSTKPFGARHMSELICSELFAVTNVANLPLLAAEYKGLRQRFGYSVVGNTVLDDIDALASSWAHTTGGDTRRTILIVPAMTTRAADYWIYGQSAQLAAGLITVFCSAVMNTLKGGSCFIGRDSSRAPKQSAGIISPVTPYSGWSRGIYYGQRDDPLGADEQAVIIADIDPTYMNEGRPRPQALPMPLKLVAHLPIIETLDTPDLVHAVAKTIGATVRPDELAALKEKPFVGVSDKIEVLSVIEKMTPMLGLNQSVKLDPSASIPNGKESYAALASAMGPFTTDEEAWKKRTEKWVANWRGLPQMGPPASVMDFILVDLTKGLGERLAEVFVPPWGSSSESDRLSEDVDGIDE